MPARARQCERELGAPVGDRATRAIPHDGLRCGGRRVDADDVGHAANLRLRRSLPAGGHRLLLCQSAGAAGDRESRAGEPRELPQPTTTDHDQQQIDGLHRRRGSVPVCRADPRRVRRSGQSVTASSGPARRWEKADDPRPREQRGLGEVLVDRHGRTLYLFQKDSGMRGACTGARAASTARQPQAGRRARGERFGGNDGASLRRLSAGRLQRPSSVPVLGREEVLVAVEPWVVGGAVAGVAFAGLTGVLVKGQAETELRGNAGRIGTVHLWLGIAVAGVVLAVAGWRWRHARADRHTHRLELIAGGTIAMLAVLAQGYLGGRMTYHHGVGIEGSGQWAQTATGTAQLDLALAKGVRPARPGGRRFRSTGSAARRAMATDGSPDL